MSTPLRIDLVSDVVCPWCAIGLARLEQAVAMRDDLSISLVWHPFVLNPDIGPEGRDMIDHLATKYGKSAEAVRASQHEIVAAAEALDLDFRQALARRAWNTTDTHRVLHYAREQGAADAMNRALFTAYFGRAENPTDPDLLARLGSEQGLSADVIREILASDAHAEAVNEEVARHRQMGITAVPSFIVEQRYLISGAQPPEALAESLARIADERVAIDEPGD